jgi:hypothetical protein
MYAEQEPDSQKPHVRVYRCDTHRGREGGRDGEEERIGEKDKERREKKRERMSEKRRANFESRKTNSSVCSFCRRAATAFV